MQKQSPVDITRITLQIIWIGILILATFWIMRPILPSLVWAAMIAAATWPFMLKVEKWLWNKRGLAVTAMTLFMLVIFIVPFSFAIGAILGNVDTMTAWIAALQTTSLPALPSWVGGIPLVGKKLSVAWHEMQTGPESLSARLAPYAGTVLKWFLSQAGSVGVIVVQFLLTVIIAAIFYSKGETASRGVVRLARKLGGEHGEEVAILAARTVRGVALGVVGTALIQSVLGGLGLAVAGVPAAAILTAVIFILCIAQLQPGFVLIPACIWLYYNEQVPWAIALLVWAVFVGLIDNFLRPVLIKKGADLPILLIFAGVLGGLISFGIVGLFIGPVVLAVTYRLLELWVVGQEALPEEIRPDLDANYK